MAAPVDTSRTYEPASPAALAAMPAPHAIGRMMRSERANSEPITAGTIRKLNTSSTPAVATDVVTTIPKLRKKNKSHSVTASAVRPL